MNALRTIERRPNDSREAAQLVIDKYGEPDEATDSQLIWHKRGRLEAHRCVEDFFKHNFPAPHIDALESVIDYRVPVDKFSELAEGDG